MEYVSSLKDIPQGQHYVILTIGSVFIPGDERSRTNPGHGYGEHTVTYPEMRVTTDRDEWENAIEAALADDPKQEKFVAYFVPGVAQISTHFNIRVNV